LSHNSEAQNIRDFSEHEPNSQELVETLKPQTRGIAPVFAAATGGTCEAYRQTRGIAPVAVADIAAIHVTFAFNSAELVSESIPTLKSLAEALKNNELEASCIKVEGHTDSRGSDAYNLKLSQRRAQSVIRYLAERMGIEADRLIAVGKGEQEPIADNNTDAGRQKNRRVQIVNLGYPKSVAQTSH
jgi:outer membrane protein OmpA-like peptidoglycan-associated protein